MRIHTDHLDDVRTAIHRAAHVMGDVYADTTAHGSRSRADALELRVTAAPRKGRRATNGGNYGAGDDVAATWDEWGAVFAAIFDADPNATCRAYDGAEHYHWTTGDRFRDGMPGRPHDTHRWEYEGSSATGAYHVNRCAGSKAYGECDAITRRVAYGRTWSEISGI